MPQFVVVFILLACIGALLPLGVKAAGPVVSVTAESSTVSSGEAVNINVQTTDVPRIYGYSFTLVYDTARLQLESTAGGPAAGAGLILGSDALVVINEETSPGRIEVAAVRGSTGAGASGQGKLAGFRFKALTEGDTTVQLEDVQLANSAASAIAEVTGSGAQVALKVSASQSGTGGTGGQTGTGTGDQTGNPTGGQSGTQTGTQNGAQTGTQSGTQTGTQGENTTQPLPVVDLGQATVSKTNVDAGTGHATVTVTFDQAGADAVLDGLAGPSILRIDVAEPGDTIQVEASASIVERAAERQTDLEVVSGSTGFRIPASAIDLKALAAALAKDGGTPPAPGQIVVRIVMEPPPAAIADAAAQRAEAEGLQTASRPMDFRIEASADGRVVTTRTYGYSFAERTVPLTHTVDPALSTGAYFDGTAYHHVPTLFTTDTDGNQSAVMRRNGDSVYVVVEQTRTFADIRDHWARSDIESMTSKLIVTGQEEGRFNPDGNVTRAEFATLLVRALGLEGQAVPSAAPVFADVAAADWYHDTVRLAAFYGLANGYPGGTFAPDAPINRQDLAVMVGRAMDMANKKAVLQPNEVQAALSRLADRDAIDGWASSAIARAVMTGVVTGYTDGSFQPSASANRAEAVVMIRRFLTAVQFINATK